MSTNCGCFKLFIVLKLSFVYITPVVSILMGYVFTLVINFLKGRLVSP